MPWVTEEEIQAAKNMTAYEYLRTHQAQRLQKTRTRNEWQQMALEIQRYRWRVRTAVPD